VGVAFLAAAPTANAAGQRSERIWWSRMPQNQSTMSHDLLGSKGATTPAPAPSPTSPQGTSRGIPPPAPPPLRHNPVRMRRRRRDHPAQPAQGIARDPS
jgi:hypothetical protein